MSVHLQAHAKRVAQTRERVMHELFALRALLDALMRPTIPGQRAIVRVDDCGWC